MKTKEEMLQRIKDETFKKGLVIEYFKILDNLYKHGNIFDHEDLYKDSKLNGYSFKEKLELLEIIENELVKICEGETK